MIVFGFIIFAVAVAVAIVAIVQNRSAMIDIHGLGYSWNVHAYWVLVAGLVIAAVALLGVAMMRTGAAHAARLRTERRGLVRENARLNELATDRPTSPVTAPVVTTPVAPVDGRHGEVSEARYVDESTAPTTAREPARHRSLFHRTSHV